MCQHLSFIRHGKAAGVTAKRQSGSFKKDEKYDLFALVVDEAVQSEFDIWYKSKTWSV